MPNINQWVARIKQADKQDLEEIKIEWSKAGEKFGKPDICKFLREFIDRELELNGVNPYASAF